MNSGTSAAGPVHGHLVCAAEDLESSLGNMRLIAELLLREDETLSAPARREYLGALAEKVSRLQLVAEDMIALARIQAQQMVLERCTLRVSEILHQAIEASGGEADRKQVSVRSAVADDEPFIAGDYWKLSRVFGGVLQSMIRAAPPGGAIAVNVEPFAEGVQLVFRRLGALVASNPALGFFPGERDFSAARLGMSVSGQIVALHGGTLQAREKDSAHSVTIRLPSAAAEAVEAGA